MSYVDGFVMAVTTARMAEYAKMARLSAKVWMDLGALAYHEAEADDVAVGKRTSFPRSVKLKEGETVVFAYVVYKSRKHRDEVMAKVMSDPRLAKMMANKDLPFDPKRMFFGGFKTLVKA